MAPASRYVDHDLTGLIDEKYEFDPEEIKQIMRQLIEVEEARTRTPYNDPNFVPLPPLLSSFASAFCFVLFIAIATPAILDPPPIDRP